MTHIQVEQQLQVIRERMAAACLHTDRNPEEVKLLLATKTVSADNIARAVEAGETLLGENKVQELQQKYSLIDSRQAEWHFIGHLQTNKVKDVLKYVTLVHSVDRLKLGQAMHKQLLKEEKQMDILIQVNTSYEESKFGAAPEDVLQLIEQLAELDTLRIKGLMTIGKLSSDPKEARKCFRLLKSIQEEIISRNYEGVSMDILSMGMSGDLEIAIEEGSTMIRVGTAIFGERQYPDSYYWNEQNKII